MNFIESIDNLILMFIQSNMRNEFMDWIMPKITSIGNVGLIWIVVAIVLLFFKEYRKYGLIIITSIVLCGIIGNIGLKNIVGRLRPCDINQSIDLLIARPTDFSFPSGHTMISFACAIILMIMNKKFGTIALVLASLIAFSRLYLYVHYPSDVIAGALIGSIIALVLAEVFIYKDTKINVYKQ